MRFRKRNRRFRIWAGCIRGKGVLKKRLPEGSLFKFLGGVNTKVRLIFGGDYY